MTLSTAYWCVLIAALLPYAWTVTAKASGRGKFDNNDPRGWLAHQTGRSVRANAALMNAFEAFPAFAAGVVLAQLAGVEPRLIAVLAVVFVIARVLHGIFYVTDRANLRSASWLIGLLCVLGLLGKAAMSVGGIV